MHTRISQSHDWIALLALMLLALGSVAFSLPHSPFWADEAYTVLAVRTASLDELLKTNLLNEETPPLYFMLLRGWSQLWGNSAEITLRLFSALAFAATVPLTGWLGMRLWNRQVGLMAALLLACNPFLRYYSQEARAYALAVLFSLLLMLAAQAYVQQPGRGRWLTYVLAGTATFYTSYFGAFMLVGAGLFCSLPWLRPAWQAEPGARRMLIGVVAAQLAIVLLLLPWVPAVLFQMEAMSTMRVPNERSPLLQYLLGLLVLGVAFPDGSITSLLLLSSISVILPPAFAAVMLRGKPEQCRFGLTQLLLPSLGMVLIFSGDGQFNPRYLLLTLPAYMLLIAAGLQILARQPRLAWILTISLALCSLAYSLSMAPSMHRQNDWFGLAQQVTAEARPGDAVFFLPPWAQAPFDIQYQGPALPYYGADSFVEYYYFGRRPFLSAYEETALQEHLAADRRAWIAWDRQYATLPDLIAEHSFTRYDYGSTTLLLIEPPAATP
jgi:mannosyltransferase